MNETEMKLRRTMTTACTEVNKINIKLHKIIKDLQNKICSPNLPFGLVSETAGHVFFFLMRVSKSGMTVDRATLRSCSVSSLFLRAFTARVAKDEYSAITSLHQKWERVTSPNLFFIVWSHDSSTS